MNLLFCVLLLPAIAAVEQFTEQPGRICNDPSKFSGFLDGHLYKICVANSRRPPRIEVIGCREVLPGEGWIPLGEEKKQDGKAYKCVGDGGSAKLISGEFALCEKQVGRVVVDKDVYKQCFLEDNNYRAELLGCVRERQPDYYLTPWLPENKEYIPLGERAQLEDNTVVQCVKDGDSAKLVSGDIEECYNRGNEEFIVHSIYYRCTLNGTRYDKQIVACLVHFDGPLRILSKSVHFAQKLPLGKIMTISHRGKKHSIKCAKDMGAGLVLSGDYQECDKRGNGVEFEENSVYKKCTAKPLGREHLHYKSEVIGCASKITGGKLVINEGISVLTRHEFCEKQGKTTALLTGEAAKIAMNLKTKPAVLTPPAVSSAVNSSELGTIETFHQPILRKHECDHPSNIDGVFSITGVVYQCKYEDGIMIAKPIGCSPPFPLYDDDSFLTFGVRKEIVEGIYQTCNVPSQTDVRIEFEHGPDPIPFLKCPSINVKNATVSYLCPNNNTIVSEDFIEGCYATITCNEGLRVHTRFASSSSRIYGCHGEMGWLGKESGVRLDSDPITACVDDNGMSHRTNVCPHIPEVPKATISYSCEGDFREDCEATVTCDYGYVLLYDEGSRQKTYTCDGKFYWVDGKSVQLAISNIDRCIPVADYADNQKREAAAGYVSVVSNKKDLKEACYFNGRQINRNDSVFINDFVFTCAEGKKERLELQFLGCFSEGAPANVAEKLRSRNIAQCDFSKVSDAEMLIFHL